MPERSLSWRAGALVRSVLPAEPAHWLMLVGSTLLYISANLRWWSGGLPKGADLPLWTALTILLTRFLVVAGAVGYYLCFVRRKARSYLPFYFIFIAASTVLMSLAGLGASWFADSGRVSVIQKTTDPLYFWHLEMLESFVTEFATGFWVAGLGFAFIAVFFALLCLGRSTLPVRLFGTETPAALKRRDLNEVDQRRVMLFVWMTISLIPVALLVGNLPSLISLTKWGMKAVNAHLNYLAWANRTSVALSMLLLILFAMGKDAKNVLRESLRPPLVGYLGVGIAIPVVIAAIWPTAYYLYDRIHWAAFAFGMHSAPQLSPYFEFPIWSYLWMLIPALFEEIGWRGFLQPRFIGRYGFVRGVFLVGIAWGAFHFSSDFHPNMAAGTIALVMARRLSLTVAQSYVLAWLTVRSGSVLPSALAHGFYNILLQMPVHIAFWLNPPLWAVSAFILFRYFPVGEIHRGVPLEPGPTLEPAT